MERSVDALWRSRSAAFWRESMPYFRYMAQSGLPGVIIMALLAGITGYGMLLRNLPANFPVVLVGVIVLTPLVCWSPLRTWLREADIVFLVPREAEMPAYIRRSMRYNGMAGIAAVLIGCAAYLPLYHAGNGRTSLFVVVLAVLLLKLLHIVAAWRERQIVTAGSRRVLRVLRWAATALAIAALLKASLLILFANCIVLLAIIYNRLPRYPIPWLTLIEEERRTRRRYTLFFSAFADIPTEPAWVKTRRYAAWAAKMIAYRKSNAFFYLYTQTLIRTELGGILLRLTALGLFTGWLAAYEALWAGWGSAGVYLLFVWLTGIQLRALAQAHRHSVWRHVYPLPEETRQSAVLRVDRRASLLCALVIWLPQCIWLVPQGYALQAVAALAVALIYVLALRPKSVKRKMSADPEED
ncbi:ABC-2 type transport system permease protein [Paenibacillus taihuensis]|uniref:ABC-2 type transport system permease protein n=1 Tax=Paenibacillus taihuensis TaxID=1156355 RepID=A0A3D9S1C6_9BACL|nr:ABC transporter permease [Paenibacillus taihuensis]REE86243.1 ABC-2 type transport system permease protein [Paenibacillus taihuensis]